ncbi:MAG: energy-coupling factor transporter ATPase [Clostridia bacterium]|nr:energy-coupling factor transporter ATPase [Clostridia bacterium]MBQ4249434.1 energy-coupling factor transporter ATPase [Clostridia bacterium]
MRRCALRSSGGTKVKIEIQNLTHTYGAGTPFVKNALDDVSITIEDHDFIGLIGHTGSGKSTLVQHLNGILKPTKGKILLDGRDMWDKDTNIRDVRFKIGLVFQYPEHQLFEETVYRDIAFGPTNMALSEDEIKERVMYALKFVGLTEDILEQSPFDLSGGQKRRVAIAGVIAMKPEVLVLDEPTAGLDPKARDDLLSQIKKYHKENNSTVIIVSHSMEDMAKTVDKIIVVKNGKIERFLPVGEIFADAESLGSMGLDIPTITKVFKRLKERGVDIDTNVYTVKYAYELMSKRLLGEVGKDA